MEASVNVIRDRAALIARHGSIQNALKAGELTQYQDITLSEALILGLLNQGVNKYIAVFGHGSTDLSYYLSFYEEAGLVRTFNVRNEIEASHCATMLRWHYGETAAVVTSIGPGALQAYAASLVPASNGIGVYYICGDETTHEEGFNMQQIPKLKQHSFLDLAKIMGNGYTLHTPEAVFSALRWGAASVFKPGFAGPFYFLMPMNTQTSIIHHCNLFEFPERPVWGPTANVNEDLLLQAFEAVKKSKRILIKLGGGADGCGDEIIELAELLDAVIVAGAKMTGVVPYHHPRFMGIGGSKGSVCGNYAMNEADLLIAVGGRAVCQWDCSGTAWKNVKQVVNFNYSAKHINHYNRSILLLGDARENLRKWIDFIKSRGFSASVSDSQWLKENRKKKETWEAYKKMRFENPVLYDEGWGGTVLTQPAAIKIAYDFAVAHDAACYFDAGDVQANGFQIVEDKKPGRTFNETGASYMGFAVSALLASAAADHPQYTIAFTGDGSLTMNPQILFDGIEHGAKGLIIVFDNRSMAAIGNLQEDQYMMEYKVSDGIRTDYVKLASSIDGLNALSGGTGPDSFKQALGKAIEYKGLSLIHLPVYYGRDELGGLGVYGSWNVGPWSKKVQKEHHTIGL